MSELSSSTKELLRAARTDGPAAAARAKIWSGVGAGGVGAAGAIGAAKGLGAASGGVGKLLAMGALFGGTVTVGIAAMLLHVGPTLRPETNVGVQADSDMAAIAPAARTTVTLDAPARPAPPPAYGAPKHAAGGRSAAGLMEDALTREAGLVATARNLVMRGDPQGALGVLHTARTLPSHALEPEELSLEARALRALHQDAEAAAAEESLKVRFPDSALAR
ncbi:MAG TPA: hypothetical protein VGI39_07750 [Polyangiaceae bacterium]|jgi:hypothetical protein